MDLKSLEDLAKELTAALDDNNQQDIASHVTSLKYFALGGENHDDKDSVSGTLLDFSLSIANSSTNQRNDDAFREALRLEGYVNRLVQEAKDNVISYNKINYIPGSDDVTIGNKTINLKNDEVKLLSFLYVNSEETWL